MKVVCVKSFKTNQYKLTYGKTYDLKELPVRANGEKFFIESDDGQIVAYHKNYFVLLEEWRQIQLGKLDL
jgi:hypothetical protein